MRDKAQRTILKMSASGNSVPDVDFRGGKKDHNGPHARNLGGGERRRSSGTEYGVARSEYGFGRDGQNPDGVEGQEQTAAMRQQRRRRAQGRV